MIKLNVDYRPHHVGADNRFDISIVHLAGKARQCRQPPAVPRLVEDSARGAAFGTELKTKRC
jgi:hypothetical protein